MDSHRIRESFLRFFEERGHRRLPSAPLVPIGDPTLLFTSAGMVPFKPYFMGQAQPPHSRLTTVQKCFRTTDIDSVGDTSHLTFFEMLGNFSIGDYFKAEAIAWAWEYVTGVLGLERERLWTAVYLDDDEAFQLWRKVGVPEERIRRYGEEHNFWFSGPVGPCGPCSEIHYDFGERFGCGPDCEPAHDCGRFLEVWNLVFMTYFRQPDGSCTALPRKNIDTGAGLERLASVALFQSGGWDRSRRPSVYDTDLFRPIVAKVEALSGRRYGHDEATDRALRIVAEHGRAVTFLLGDERTPVVPSNEERGYVVRRVLRRAVYFGYRYLGLEEPFLDRVAQAVIDLMADVYPELQRQRQFVLHNVRQEEERFRTTLERGLQLLEERLAGARGVLSARDAFDLHDTYGFPVELTREIARERGISLDEEGFERLMEEQRERARAAARGTGADARAQVYASLSGAETPFIGYDTLEAPARVVALMARRDGSLARASRLSAPAEVEVVLSQTPFYPEGGGQVGDRGEIVGPSGRVLVLDTQRLGEGVIVHRGQLSEGVLAEGDEVLARVDRQHREDTMRNHTGTHLLHAALRRVLGSHVRQAGSLVAPDRLRFDFTHPQALTAEEIAQVEALVNEKIRQNLPVEVRYTTFQQAMEEGALAFFGEKYGEEVRLVEINTVSPRFSLELCGGTHCRRTGDVGAFVIVGESAVAAGIRRIEALTGRGATEFVRRTLDHLEALAARLGTSPQGLAARLESLLEEQDALRRRIRELERALASGPSAERLLERSQQVDGVRLVAVRVEVPSLDALRYLGDALRQQMGSGVAVLGAVIEGRPSFLTVVTGDLTGRLHAGELVRRVAAVAGGGGGGRPDLGQGGGKDAARLDEALAQAGDIVRQMLEQA
ncbi:MAG TPA: alanine--tRNA ligase [Dehalococcoidia bacterium]|nr:alanine--tRNA ligase [Dehalococcoidia bacterium]